MSLRFQALRITYRCPYGYHLGNIVGSFHDNSLTLSLDAVSPEEAIEFARPAIDNFLQHLSLQAGHLFSHKVLAFADDQNNLYDFTMPRILMASVTMYNLERLKSDISNAARSAQFSNLVLTKALQYYEHALFLFEKRGEIADLQSRHFSFLISAAFLSMWKAVSTIVGDPPKDKDYKYRYKQFGLTDEFYKNEIEFVRGIRNDEDVAHYAIERDRKKVEANFGKAKDTAIKVIKAYIEHISKE